MRCFVLLLTATTARPFIFKTLTLFFLCLTLSLVAQEKQVELEYYSKEQLGKLAFTPEQIKEDVAILGEIINYIHPAPYAFTDSSTLQSYLAQLEQEMIRQPDLISAYKAISRFTANIQCSHTFTNPWNQGEDVKKAIFDQPDKLPFTFERIGKRLFIDKNASASQKLKRGMEILSINGLAVDSILTQLAHYVSSDGNNYGKRLERLALSGSEKYSFFDIYYPIVFGSYQRIDLKLKDFHTGKVFHEMVQPTSKTKRTSILKERYNELGTSMEDLWSFKIINDNAGLLQAGSFAIFDNQFDWKSMIDDAVKELNDNKTPNLIIDIRGNEGGLSEIGGYMLQKVLKEPITIPVTQSSVRYLAIPEQYQKYIGTWDKTPYDFSKKVSRKKGGRYPFKSNFASAGNTYKPQKNGYKGQVYLITDATNSSATHIMATYAQQMSNVTLVGQETGGNQLGINGSYMFFLNLPNTGIEVDIPVINSFIPPIEGEARDGGIIPDIIVEKTWEDLVKGKDTELERILSIIHQQ